MSEPRILPRKRFLLVEMEPPVREGGIEIPWSYYDVMVTARVQNVGPLVESIKVGDRVLMGRWAGIDFKRDKKTLYICHEREVDAVVGEDEVILARPPGSTDTSKPPYPSIMKRWDRVEVRST